MKKIIFIIALFFITILLLPKFLSFERTPFQKNWLTYKAQFIKSGKVTVTDNSTLSTSILNSEQQGFALLFAVFSNDRKEFETIWEWTQKNLQREDHLFKQQYISSSKSEIDSEYDNKTSFAERNASSGDIIIAWALLAAENKWDRQVYLVEGMRVLDAIKTKLIRQNFGYQLILPSETGFELSDGSIQINLSYWIFPAFNLFTEVTGDSIWSEVYKSGISLMKSARFGEWQLPPDWLILSKNNMTLEGTISPKYGENANRLPMYLILAQDEQVQLMEPFMTFWEQGTVPTTVNLLTGEVSESSTSSGMQVIKAFTETNMDMKKGSKAPQITAETDYYLGTFILLSQLPLITQ